MSENQIVEKELLKRYANEKYPGLLRDENYIDLNSEHAQNFLKTYTEPKAFDKIGYARPLGGFFYQFFYAILTAGVMAVLYTFLLSYVFPWPESRSMVDIAGVLFLLIQTIFNIPTNFALEMFIGDYRIKNPMKMVEYIRFYIWYQAMTGVGLVTVFSFFIIQGLNTGNLIWAKWIMLIIIAREYPAFTNVFITIIRGLQKFNYEAGLNFIMYTIFNNLFQIGGAIWGRWILGSNPRFGPLFGIAIGLVIGQTLGELANMFLCMTVVNKVLSPLGFSMRDIFTPKVSKEVIWKSVKFGFMVSIPAVVSSLSTTFMTLWWYAYVPAYITFLTLSKLADELANSIKAGGGINIYATISEAINNGKKELTSYYISMIWKFVFFFKFAIGAILISFIPLVLEILLIAGGAENYILAAAFIMPNIIATVIEQPQSSAEVVIVGASKPEINTVLAVIQQGLNIFFTWLWLIELKLPERWGIQAVVWIMPLGLFIPMVLRTVLSWLYIHKKIAPVRCKEFSWQTFIAPIIPALIIIIIAKLWYMFVFENMIILLGGTDIAMIIAGVVSILFAFVGCLMFIFMPLYGAFGGWDTNTLAIFDEAVAISGPSRFLFLPINKATHLLVSKSRLHNKFQISYLDAHKEADDLMKERFIKDRLTQEILSLQNSV